MDENAIKALLGNENGEITEEKLDELLELLQLFEGPSAGGDNAAAADDSNAADDADEADDDDVMMMDPDTAEKSASQWHNDAVGLVRAGNYSRAVQMCMAGLEFFPNDVDLLADTIKYSSDCGKQEIAEKYYGRLLKLPRGSWNWRAYIFSLDYLNLNAAANEAACRQLIADGKRYLPYEEKIYMCESELESKLGNQEQSMAILKEALQRLPNAPQCALRLMDMQMERGLYRQVIETADYGISASCEAQPSINIPYLLFIRTLAQDAILHQRKAAKETVTAEEIDALHTVYGTLKTEFPELLRFGRVISTRQKCLNFMKLTA